MEKAVRIQDNGKIKRITEALRSRLANNDNEITVRSTGDILGVFERSNGVQVYYYGNAYTKDEDCDLLGEWSNLESFVKNVLL